MNRTVLKIVLKAAAVVGLPGLSGCFGELAFPAPQAGLPRLPPPPHMPAPTARDWLDHALPVLEGLIPGRRWPALTTSTLPAEPREVYARFGIDPDTLGSPIWNFAGVLHTAVVARGDAASDRVGGPEPPPWPGFESVWVPTDDAGRTFAQFGRLGLQRDPRTGQPRPADAVVIVVGFLGNLGGYRYRDLSAALLAKGFHVLAVEPRGHGQTARAHPDVPMTFGVLEGIEALTLADWMRAAAPTNRVSLIGFSWGATNVLMAAWLDGTPQRRPANHPIWNRVPPRGPLSRLDGGVLAISPVLDMPAITAAYDQPASLLGDPIRHFVQSAFGRYLALRQAPVIDHKARTLIDFDYARCSLAAFYPTAAEGQADGFAFLDLFSPAGRARLAGIRTPTLVVHSANDPLAPAHAVAALSRGVDNPNLAIMVTPGGGHGGLPAVSTPYYYALIFNFLDRATGPRAVAPSTVVPSAVVPHAVVARP